MAARQSFHVPLAATCWGKPSIHVLQIDIFKHICMETPFGNNKICSARGLHPMRWSLKIFQIAWKKVNFPTNIGHIAHK